MRRIVVRARAMDGAGSGGGRGVNAEAYATLATAAWQPTAVTALIAVEGPRLAREGTTESTSMSAAA